MIRSFIIIWALTISWIFFHAESCAQTTPLPKYKTNLSSTKDSIEKLDSLVNKYKISDNDLAIHYARNALNIARVKRDPEDLITAYMLMAMVYFHEKKDSSLIFNNKALSIADSTGNLKWKVPLLYNLAMINSSAYDFNKGIELLDSSVAIAVSIKDTLGMARGYNELGNTKFDMGKPDDSRVMFDSAVAIAQRYHLKVQWGAAVGNLARFDEDPIPKLKQALGILSNVKGAEEEMAITFTKIAANYYLKPDSAIYYNKAAIQVSSVFYLPEILMAAYNSLAYNYFDKGDLEKAEYYLREKAIPIAKKENNDDWLASLNDTYAEILGKKGDFRNAFEKQKEAFSRRTAANKQRGMEQILLTSALLDLKNKELQIQNETKKVLIRENSIKNLELGLIGLVFLVLVSVLITFLLQQRNRAKLQNEQMASARRLIDMEESEKGRTARELHDITGQLVMGISGEIENLDLPDEESKEALQRKIKTLGNSIRQISHRMNRAMIEQLTFSELIEGQCEDVQRLSGLKVKFEMIGEMPELPGEVALHLYRIVQELLTNATKYVANGNVRIEIATRSNQLILSYRDNGPGFEKKEKNLSGMGFMNIFERTKLIGGKATVDSSPGNGTSWEISYPVSTKENVKI